MNRATHFETCIRFVEDNLKDIDPEIYIRYNLDMYKRAHQDTNGKKFIPYFRKEATRYREYINYQLYISICAPTNRIREWLDKLRYVFYILGIKVKI